ncbi:Peptide exporter [Forsythia ovata]|uniref:Peptide exporter n=1 Tax=Forsythia ovata TaxID=205694 RepID=A0ABD1SPX4_9LAMI
MKDGRITQDGKYNDILKSGSDFMELVGAHKEALSAFDSIEAGAAVVGEDSSTRNAKNFLQKKESPTDQNDKTDNAMWTNGQLIQATTVRKLNEDVNKYEGIKTRPSWSWIEVGDRIHRFFDDDRYHSDSEEIYQKLEVIVHRAAITTTDFPLQAFRPGAILCTVNLCIIHWRLGSKLDFFHVPNNSNR